MAQIKHRIVARPGIALLLLLSLTIFFSAATGFVMDLLNAHIENTQVGIRLSAIMQDIFVFIVPALLTAVIATRLPAKLIGLTERTPWMTLIYVAAIAVFSIPVMDCIIEWNKGLSLPESMASIEKWMIDMEQANEALTNILLGTTSTQNIIVSILIVGVLAGFSEELFFRGVVQRLLGETALGAHGAIWITAIIFSAAHVQFLGFFPRLLLGAYFGYLFYWSRSLWMPVIAHALNNTMAVTAYYVQGNENPDVTISNNSIPLIIAGIVLTAAALSVMRRQLSSRRDVEKEK